MIEFGYGLGGGGGGGSGGGGGPGFTQKTTHVEQGLDRRLEQYRNDPDLEQIMTSLLTRVQEAEDCLWEILNNRGVDTAIGVQLDVLGRLVGRGRGTLGDDAYRIAIKCQIAINRSSGTPVDICLVAILSLPAGFVWTYGEGYPAGIDITLVDPWIGSDEELDVVFSNLQKTRSGGVRLFFEYHTAPTDHTFTWSDDLTTPVDHNLGWGSHSDPSIGGYWAGILSE